MIQKALGAVGRSISIDTFTRVVRVLDRNSDAAEPRSVRQLAHSAQISINTLNAIKQGRHHLWAEHVTLTGVGWTPERFLTFKSSRIRKVANARLKKAQELLEQGLIDSALYDLMLEASQREQAQLKEMHGDKRAGAADRILSNSSPREITK